MSETCRVIINQVKQKLHLFGYLPIQYYKDARYHEHKIIHWLFDWLQCAVIRNRYAEFCHNCVRRIRQIVSRLFSNTETN